jgi:thiol-disulfide isomerase/thioredoxin
MARSHQFFAPAIALLVAFTFTGTLRAQAVNWRHDVSAARREAQATGRPLFLDFGTQACMYCQKLDAITFRVPAVARMLNDYFIPVHIDADRERELTSALGIHAYPTLVLTDSQGKIINKQEGFCEAGAMMAFLEPGKQLASAAPRPQYRAQAKEDRIPARNLAIEEPVRRPQPSAGEELAAARSEAIRLPSPEELGLATDKPALAIENRPTDWTAVHARLDRLGATSLQVLHSGGQLVRIVSMFPSTENRVHRVEASGTTEAEALRLFLEQVDEWAAHP